MIFKLLIVCAAAVVASAGVIAPYASPYSAYPAQPAYATQQQNIIRSPYNLGQVTSFSKTVDTPYSSVTKSDVRVSNPGYAVGAYGGYPAAYHGGLGYAAPAAYHGGLGYAAPAAYHGGLGYAAPAAYGLGYGAAKVAAPGLLGVAYSAAPTVSHMTYSNGLGLAYAW